MLKAAALALTSVLSNAGTARHVDFLISAGHEGRPASCVHFPKRACNLGAAGEQQWTPIVADEIARALRTRGYSTARKPADFAGRYNVRAAVFIHFDGSAVPCSSGASIGYHEPRFHTAAKQWRRTYGRIFPFRFQPDDFTTSLHDYYGFRQIRASKAALVLELGEITCPAQRAWLAPRLRRIGDVIAGYLERLR